VLNLTDAAGKPLMSSTRSICTNNSIIPIFSVNRNTCGGMCYSLPTHALVDSQ
jgi:hypothetical protein